MNQTDTLILEKVYSMFADVKSSGVISQKQWREACKALGEPEKYKVFSTFTKLSRGQYRICGTTKENITAQSKQEKVPRKQEIQSQPAPSVVQNYIPPKVNQAKFGEIPSRDADFVVFGPYKDIETVIKSKKFFPIFITGMSGNGKSSMPIEACARHNIPIIRYPVTGTTSTEDLIGSKTLVDGNVVIVEGPVLIAMRNGIPVLLDELDAAQANNIMCLQGILEGKPYYFSLTNEYIVPKPGFNIIATGNTKGKGSDDGRYIGTNILNDAFLERFPITIEQEYPTEPVETKMLNNWILSNTGKENTKLAENLAKWAAIIRKTYADGGVDDLISTRRLKHIVETYAIFNDMSKSIKMCTSRFDKQTSEAFQTVFDKLEVGGDATSNAPVKVDYKVYTDA